MLPVGSRNKNSHWDYETGCTQDCCVTSNMKTSSNLKVIFHSSAQCLFFFFSSQNKSVHEHAISTMALFRKSTATSKPF